MEQDTGTPKLSLDEVHARMGLIVTEEGKARARQRRLAARERHDPAARAAFLEQLRARPA
ncbi:hypothetical protein [Actinoplanes rectilineatus]|uniref:hypothetical protein n=1 Tax=Actinoplanes rectilineatus TaxID=113571 RepID=UPI0005F29736|nr:hypothetical protein [Actinoplanes rectilineatus]